MSKKKRGVAKSSETNQIVVGGDVRAGRSVSKKGVLIIGVVIVVLGVVGGAAYYKISHDNAKKDQAKKDATAVSSKVPAAAAKMTEVNGKSITAIQRSQQAIYYGDYNGGQQILKDQLSLAKTDADKVSLYMQLAANALNAKKYDEANGYAQQALGLQKTVAVYSLLAAIAAQQGDKTKAIDYANKQKALLDSKSPSYQQSLDSINQFIKGQQ